MKTMRSSFEYEIVRREYDDMWQVLAKLSSVRLGQTSREQVKSGECVDAMVWQTVHVEKNERDCKKWVDEQWENLLRLGIPYEVST